MTSDGHRHRVNATYCWGLRVEPGVVIPLAAFQALSTIDICAGVDTLESPVSIRLCDITHPLAHQYERPGRNAGEKDCRRVEAQTAGRSPSCRYSGVRLLTPLRLHIELIKVSPPGSGKSTVVDPLLVRVNTLLDQEDVAKPGETREESAICVSLDGWHMYRHELDAMPDPKEAHWRRVSQSPVTLQGRLMTAGRGVHVRPGEIPRLRQSPPIPFDRPHTILHLRSRTERPVPFR